MSSNSLEYEIIADRIVRFPSALKKYDYVDVVESLGQPEWTANKSISDEFGPTRAELTYEWEGRFPEWAHYFLVTQAAVFTYCKEILNVDYPLYEIMDSTKDVVHISKYRINGSVDPHADEGYEEDNGVYTIIWYLNDDYEGGELGFSKEGIELKAEAGDVFIYPSYFVHYANAVTKGFKYISIRRETLY